MAYLKLAMDTAFESISSAASMLLIKDLVLLVSSALGAVPLPTPCRTRALHDFLGCSTTNHCLTGPQWQAFRLSSQAPASLSECLSRSPILVLAGRTRTSAGQCGYHFAPLLDALTGAKAKYHELLAAALEPEVSRIVAECSGRAMQVRSADQAAELSASLGLPLSWRSVDDSLGPTAPFVAPFSSAVPELLRITRR